MSNNIIFDFKDTNEAIENMIGKKYGLLTITKFLGIKYGGLTSKRKIKLVECKCECGKILEVNYRDVLTNNTFSCGSPAHRKNYVNGKTNHSLYSRWRKMLDRCYNPNSKNYKRYGLRGIKVCEQWKNSYAEFYQWAIKNNYSRNLDIDRINNNGNYEPQNCRFVNRSTNCFNKRTSKLSPLKIKDIIEAKKYLGKSFNAKEAAIVYGISIGYLYQILGEHT